MILTIKEIKNLAEFVGLRVDESLLWKDEMDDEITIVPCMEEGDLFADGNVYGGHYAYFREHQGRGACPLGEKK